MDSNPSDDAGWSEFGSRETTPLPYFLASGPPVQLSVHSRDVESVKLPGQFSDITESYKGIRREAMPMSLGASMVTAKSWQPFLAAQVPNDYKVEIDKQEKESLIGRSFVQAYCFADAIDHVLRYVGNLKDAEALLASSLSFADCVVEAINRSSYPLYMPLSVRTKAEENALMNDRADLQWPIAGKPRKRVAALLRPQLWTEKRTLLQPKVIEVTVDVEVFRPTCGFGFGVVPDEEFLRDPQGSRKKALFVDNFGRLHCEGNPTCLYGIHIAESDRLNMLIETVGDQINGSFTLNGCPIQSTSFTLKKKKAYSAVVYFDVCLPSTTPTLLTSPVHIERPLTCLERSTNLILKGLGPELLELLLPPSVVEHLTLDGLRQRVAQHYSARFEGQVADAQVQVWVGSSIVEDTSTPLVQLVRGELHMKDIYIHIM